MHENKNMGACAVNLSVVSVKHSSNQTINYGYHVSKNNNINVKEMLQTMGTRNSFVIKERRKIKFVS